MEIKRRQLLTNKDEGLLLSTSSPEVMYRYTEWQAMTGLDGSLISAEPVCAVPLPIYAAEFEGPRRFSQVPPELLWHPLFWLPARLANRYNLPTGPDGAKEVESAAVWSTRVALELSASGLYDADEGWLDILATVGIDVDNEADVARIAEWQAGYPDEDLDSIDLDLHLKLGEDPNWALTSAVLMKDTLAQAQWAFLADSLFGLLLDAGDPTEGGTLEQLRETLKVAANLAEVQLTDVPVVDGSEPAAVFWERIADEAADPDYTDAASFLDGPVAEATNWLAAVRDEYWGRIADLNSALSPA